MKKNKKIGVLTFQDTVNYGAMLQTYALQKYINNQKIPCEVIDYKNEALEKVERPIKLFEQRSIKGIIKYFKCHKYQVRKWDSFAEFKNKNINVSSEIYTKNDVNKIEDNYEMIVVGSDQVWNTELTNKDYTYYLDFVKDNKKKNSYAASFGFSEWPEDIKEDAIKNLKTFNTLNVREEQAKKMLDSEIKEQDINVVMDPTFLLTKKDWEKFVEKKEENYIVVYMIDFRKEVFDFIKNLAKENNCKIVYIHDAIKSQSGMENSRDASVENFLSLVYNAKYVVTGSFHALCISLIYEKQFYYTLNSRNNRNSRLINLIDIAGIKNKRIIDGKCDNTDMIDYTEVNKNLMPKIEESRQLLNKMLGELSNNVKN